MGQACIVCGLTIYPGLTHSCGSSGMVSQQPQPQPSCDWAILTELQKISALLEKAAYVPGREPAGNNFDEALRVVERAQAELDRLFPESDRVAEVALTIRKLTYAEIEARGK